MLVSFALLIAAFVSVSRAFEEPDSAAPAPSRVPYRMPGTCAPDLTKRDPDPRAMLWVRPGTERDLVWSCTQIGAHHPPEFNNALKGWWRDHEVRLDDSCREVGVFWPDAKHECGRCWDENTPGDMYDYGRLDSLDDMEGGTMELTLAEYDDEAAEAAGWTEESDKPYPTKSTTETCKVVDRTICSRNTLGLAWNEYTEQNVAQAIAEGGKAGECEHVKLCYGHGLCCLQGEVI